MKPPLSVSGLQQCAAEFADLESRHIEPLLFGITDGKAVGTYLEQKFRQFVATRFSFESGNCARGIDFPDLEVDVKTTSIRQPQSSCPFKSARQKIFGLGYSLLVFVYSKYDDRDAGAARLDVQSVIFVEARRTADFQMTRAIRKILESEGNLDDVIALMHDSLLPVDDMEAQKLAEEILRTQPEQGFLTISNALQWRLQYRRVIEQAGAVDGVIRLR
jgi:hypothetical protein